LGPAVSLEYRQGLCSLQVFGDFEVETSGRYTFREQNVLLVLGSSLSSKLNDFLADVIHANVFSRVVHLALGQ
jgi:hypothetical protein